MDIVLPWLLVWMTDDKLKKRVAAGAPSRGDTMGLYMVKVRHPREVVGWLHVTTVEE